MISLTLKVTSNTFLAIVKLLNLCIHINIELEDYFWMEIELFFIM